jgi:hypothetical protein
MHTLTAAANINSVYRSAQPSLCLYVRTVETTARLWLVARNALFIGGGKLGMS